VIDTAVVAAAVAIVTAGCTVECIQWDLRLRNQLVVAAVAVVEANQGSIAGQRRRRYGIYVWEARSDAGGVIYDGLFESSAMGVGGKGFDEREWRAVMGSVKELSKMSG